MSPTGRKQHATRTNATADPNHRAASLVFIFLQPVLLHLSVPLILFILSSYLQLFPGGLSSCSAQAVEESRELCNCYTQSYLWKAVALDGWPFRTLGTLVPE